MMVLLWLAPTIVAHTPLRNWLAAKFIGGTQSSVTVGRAKFGWLSPISFENVEVRDEAGRITLALPRVTAPKSLLATLTGTGDSSTIRLEKPSLTVVVAQETADWERVFSGYGGGEGQWNLEVVAGEIILRNAALTEEWRINSVNSKLIKPRGQYIPSHCELQAIWANGSVAVAWNNDPLSGAALKVKLENAPLSPFSTFIGDTVTVGTS